MKKFILSINIILFFLFSGCNNKSQVNLNMRGENKYTIGGNCEGTVAFVQYDDSENRIAIPEVDTRTKILKRRVIATTDAYVAHYEGFDREYTTDSIRFCLETCVPFMIQELKKKEKPKDELNLNSNLADFDIVYRNIPKLNLASEEDKNEIENIYRINLFFSELIKKNQSVSDLSKVIRKIARLNACACLMNYIDFLGLVNMYEDANNIKLAIAEFMYLRFLYIIKPYILKFDKSFFEEPKHKVYSECEAVNQNYEEYVANFYEELFNFTHDEFFKKEFRLLTELSNINKNPRSPSSILRKELGCLIEDLQSSVKVNKEVIELLSESFNYKKKAIESIFQIFSEGFKIAVEARDEKKEESSFLNNFFLLYNKFEDCYNKYFLNVLEKGSKLELDSFFIGEDVHNYIESISDLNVPREEIAFMLKILPLSIFLSKKNNNTKDDSERIIGYIVKKYISKLGILNDGFYESCSDGEVFYKKNNKKNNKKETQIVLCEKKSKDRIFDKIIEILSLEENQILFNTIKKIFMQRQALKFLIDNEYSTLMAKTYGFSNNNEAKLLLAELIADYFLFNQIRVNKDVLNGKKSEFSEFVSKSLVDFPSYEISEILSLKKDKDEILGKVKNTILGKEVFDQIIETSNKKSNKVKKKRNNEEDAPGRVEKENFVLPKQEFLNEISEVIPEKPIILTSLEKKRNFIKESIHPYTPYDYAEITYKKYKSLSSSELFVCTLMYDGFYIPVFYSVRSGFFFTQLPKNVFMVDIDFTADENYVRETTIAMYLDYLQDYAKKNELAMKVSESTNGMHIYVHSYNMERRKMIEHMSNFACDPDYTSSVFHDETNGSVRISQKIFEKNICGSGYSNSFKTYDEIRDDFVEKPRKEFILSSMDNNDLNNFMTIFTHLYRIIPPLNDTIISLMNDQYFQAWSIFLKNNYKRYGSNEDLIQAATPFIYFLAQNINRNMGNLEGIYTVNIVKERYDVFCKMLEQSQLEELQHQQYSDTLD